MKGAGGSAVNCLNLHIAPIFRPPFYRLVKRAGAGKSKYSATLRCFMGETLTQAKPQVACEVDTNEEAAEQLAADVPFGQ